MEAAKNTSSLMENTIKAVRNGNGLTIATASEELNAQAEQMKGYVEELAAVVGGSGSGGGQRSMASTVRPDRNSGVKRAALPAPKKAGKAFGKKGTRPEQIIPMDDADFKDF